MMTRMLNPTDSTVSFEIAGLPGSPVKKFAVKPGECCEVPTKYVESGCIDNIAPGLIVATEEPEKPTPPDPGEPPAPESKPKAKAKKKK